LILEILIQPTRTMERLAGEESGRRRQTDDATRREDASRWNVRPCDELDWGIQGDQVFHSNLQGQNMVQHDIHVVQGHRSKDDEDACAGETASTRQPEIVRTEKTLVHNDNTKRRVIVSRAIARRLIHVSWIATMVFGDALLALLSNQLVVDAWLTQRRWLATPSSALQHAVLRMYAKNGRADNSTTSGLFYRTVNATEEPTLIGSSNVNDFVPPAGESTSGSFGDIMAPSIDDADVLFRDGLVTKESKSLSQTYGITNPLDRMAVTANGNLQRLFSSYYDAPVLVQVEHCTPQLRSIQQQLDSFPASWSRRVLLQIFNQTFCTADSLVVVHSAEVEELIETGKVGIGQLFRHFNVLPEFALLAAGPLEGGGFWRNYTLTSQELVTCHIHEVFCRDVWHLKASPGEHGNGSD
jgi:uncharacterized membrane protein